MLQTIGFFKFAEEDNWKDGCLPDTTVCFSDEHIKFTGKDEAELLNNIMEFFDVKRDAIEVNACDEQGRIDVAVTENANSQQLSKQEMKDWKRGKIKAWYAIYTLHAEDVSVHTFA